MQQDICNERALSASNVANALSRKPIPARQHLAGMGQKPSGEATAAERIYQLELRT
ncbi:hypothetical protein predicted by Glimmer/Critica (plasmid) [Sinorhizobium fredii HH103]|uniref:Uncharacterized protein n=1 Tax=Sinorhizobium fredii (strain HH103) TaxID=1117943 RepID=G9AEY0_SINF1|nr:hypothetical protein predicted by Glimmer/Critica [Sinorhizobium fredii HH103]